MHRALTLPKDEREMRMKQLRRREQMRDVNFWLKQVLKSVECLGSDEDKSTMLEPFSESDIDNYLSKYVTESSRLCLILDYDGTLAPIAPTPDLAHLPCETKQVLERISHMPDVDISIISGRSLDNVRKMVGIDGITYAGNHGFEIQHPDGSMFTYPVPHEFVTKLNKLRSTLPQICDSGAYVEDKGVGLTFHYRNVDSSQRQQIMDKAKKLFKEADLIPQVGLMNFEAIPPVTWDTGRAAIYILRTLFGVDWCERVSTIYCGDDLRDEDAMRTLHGMAMTFRITDSQNTKTAANYRLPNPDAVLTMLRWIEKRLGVRAPTAPIGIRSRTASVSSGTGCGSPSRKSSQSCEFSNSPPPRSFSSHLIVVPDYDATGRRADKSPNRRGDKSPNRRQ